jgi:hypothetical protein
MGPEARSGLGRPKGTRQHLLPSITVIVCILPVRNVMSMLNVVFMHISIFARAKTAVYLPEGCEPCITSLLSCLQTGSSATCY